MVLKYWKMMIRSVKSISSRCSVMIFSRIDRVVSLLLVASLLLCCVPALAVPAAAADTEMYLYNGVELPDINKVWTDKETYPYACIYPSLCGERVDSSLAGQNVWLVQFTSEQGYYIDEDETGFVGYHFDEGIPHKCCTALLCGTQELADALVALSDGATCPVGEWFNIEHDSHDGSNAIAYMADSHIQWANHDILRADGSIYLKASDPVPVNSPSSIFSVSIVSPDIVQAGLYIVASVDVSGSGDFDSSATLTLSGNASSGTYLKKGAYGNNWTLFCGSDETASKLTLTAASLQDPSVTASKIITVGKSGGDPSDPTTPSEPVDPDPSDPTIPEETQPGNSGALTDKSDDISDGLGDIHDFEQSQKDVLDNNMDTIMVQVDFVNLIPALAFVGGYINKAWLSMSAIQLIFTVPLFLGLFFFLCSRIPGATRWKARRPPPDPTKKG